jgi:hypothetical protein
MLDCVPDDLLVVHVCFGCDLSADLHIKDNCDMNTIAETVSRIRLGINDTYQFATLTKRINKTWSGTTVNAS